MKNSDSATTVNLSQVLKIPQHRDGNTVNKKVENLLYKPYLQNPACMPVCTRLVPQGLLSVQHYSPRGSKTDSIISTNNQKGEPSLVE